MQWSFFSLHLFDAAKFTQPNWDSWISQPERHKWIAVSYSVNASLWQALSPRGNECRGTYQGALKSIPNCMSDLAAQANWLSLLKSIFRIIFATFHWPQRFAWSATSVESDLTVSAEKMLGTAKKVKKLRLRHHFPPFCVQNVRHTGVFIFRTASKMVCADMKSGRPRIAIDQQTTRLYVSASY